MPRNNGIGESLLSIFGTSDGRRAWAVGNHGTILESDDGGANLTARKSGTNDELFIQSSGPATVSGSGPSAPTARF